MHDIKNLDAAHRYIKDHGGDKHDRDKESLVREDSRIIDLIRDDIVDPKASKLASKLSVLINYRNCAYTTTSAISECLGIDKTNISKKLQILNNQGLVYCDQTKGSTSPERTLVFNPSLYWKGSFRLKNIIEDKILLEGHDWRDLSKLEVDEAYYD